MININDVIKLSDYKNIYIEKNGDLVYKANNKIYNIKGDNVKRYITDIFYDLFQQNYVVDLFKKLEEIHENNDEMNTICEKEFLAALLKLYKLGLIEISRKNGRILGKDQDSSDFKGHSKTYCDMVNKIKYKKILIINFLYSEDIEPLIKELNKTSLTNISIINIVPDIIYLKKKIIAEKNRGKINFFYERHTNLLNLEDHLQDSDFLLTLHSADNITLNKLYNKYSIHYKIPWLNSTVNDVKIEIGPLVVYNKTACYECYTHVNDLQETVYSDRSVIPLKTYNISRRSSIYITLGYLMDEIIKFLYFDSLGTTPLSVDNILTINGLSLNYCNKPIIKLPNCKICGI